MNETVSVAFLALAAGSILYVVIQLMNVNRQLGHKELVAWMLLAGLFLGFATDFVIEAAGVYRRIQRSMAEPPGRRRATLRQILLGRR